MGPARSGNSMLLLVAAFIIHIISWMTPVFEGGTGYEAYLETYKMFGRLGELFKEEQTSLIDKITLVCAAISPHTNYIIALCFLALFLGGNNLNATILNFFRISLPICFVINLAWVYGFWKQLDAFRIGYYLWMLSFLLAALAARSFYVAKKQ